MDGKTLITCLKQLCRDIDGQRPLKRIHWKQIVAPPLIGFALAATGCSTIEPPAEPQIALYAAPMPPSEICDDRIDNNSNGSVDCADPDCASFLGCNPVPEYGAPIPQATTPPPSGVDPDAVDVYGGPFMNPAPGSGQ